MKIILVIDIPADYVICVDTIKNKDLVMQINL